MRTAKTLIRLGGFPGRSESSLGAHAVFFLSFSSFFLSFFNAMYICISLNFLSFFDAVYICISFNYAVIKQVLSSKQCFSFFPFSFFLSFFSLK